MTDYSFRRLDEDDSLEELTAFLHRAYAAHAAAGRTFFASYQTADDTRRRVAKGECWLAFRQSRMVGTVTVIGRYDAPPGFPTAPGSGSFQQLAVLPEHRSRGLGGLLVSLAEQRLTELGTTQVVIDTSSLASDLIAWYERRGYVRAGTWKWSVTNYESVVLAKTLG